MLAIGVHCGSGLFITLDSQPVTAVVQLETGRLDRELYVTQQVSDISFACCMPPGI